jgi:hypothetical protein
LYAVSIAAIGVNRAIIPLIDDLKPAGIRRTNPVLASKLAKALVIHIKVIPGYKILP